MTVSDPDVLDKDENTSMKSDEDNPDKDIEKSGDYGSIDVLDKNQETSADPDPEASADPDPEVPKNELSPLISTHDDGNDDGKVSPEDSAELAFRELWTLRAIRISYLSIGLTLATGFTGIMYAFLFESSAMLGYGCNSFVDVLSSILVVWRFSKSLDPSVINDEAYNRRLEKRAGAGIAMTFVGIAIFVGVQASVHIAIAEEPADDSALIVLAAFSVLVFTSLACFKFFISIQLSSSTMKKDAISSFAVGVLSLGVCISSSVYDMTSTVWWFDAVVALITSVCLFWYGYRTLFCHGHKWWEPSWWSEDPESVAFYQKQRAKASNTSSECAHCCTETPDC